MAKELTITMNAQLTFIETGTEAQYGDLVERIKLFGGIKGWKEALIADITDALKTDGPLTADDVQLSDVKIFIGDIEEADADV